MEDTSLKNSFISLLNKASFPVGDESKIEIKELTGGVMRKVYVASTENGKYLLRKLNPSDPPEQNQLERDCLKELGEIGVSPKIYTYEGEFNLEEFFDSHISSSANLADKEVFSKIMFCLGKIHSLDRSLCKSEVNYCIESMEKHASVYENDNYLNYLKENNKETLLKCYEMVTNKENYQKVKEYFSKSTQIVGHNDFFGANILVADKEVKIVDYERAGLNSPACDLAKIFVDHKYVREASMNYTFDNSVDFEEGLFDQYVKVYLHSRAGGLYEDNIIEKIDDICLKTVGPDCNDQVKALREEMNVAMAAIHFYFPYIAMQILDEKKNDFVEMILTKFLSTCLEFFDSHKKYLI